jgi:hypothetical protein
VPAGFSANRETAGLVHLWKQGIPDVLCLRRRKWGFLKNTFARLFEISIEISPTSVMIPSFSVQWFEVVL